MAGPRPSKAGMPASRPLLNLGSGDKSGLEKAFQALVGTPKSQPTEKSPYAESPQFAQALDLLKSLGFQFSLEHNPIELIHPLAPDRRVVCQPPTDGKFDAESFALDWAVRHFPEMEFYLPFIVRRAALAKKSQTANGRPTTPEPEYDDDGFLADYN